MLSGALAVILLAYPALSAPDGQVGSVLVDRLLQRVVQLEDRTDALRKQVDSLQRQVDNLQRAGVASGARGNAPIARGASDCNEPFYRDYSGRLKVRSECLGAGLGPNCDPPFLFDESGDKRDRPECRK